MQTKAYHIKSTVPCLMHKDVLSNPLSELTKQYKKVHSKRKKTDSDYEELSRMEWYASIYWSESEGPYWPGVNIEAMLVSAAKLQKLGTKFKSAIMVCDDRNRLIYDGPKGKDELFKDGRFIDVRSVRVSQSKVMRTRPMFPEWELEFKIIFNDTIIEERDLDKALEDAATIIGLSDYRPRFGRFEVL